MNRISLGPIPISQPRSSIVRLPYELIKQIIREVGDPQLSIYLGITFRRFYAIHRSIFPNKVSLRVGYYICDKLERLFLEPCKSLRILMERGVYLRHSSGSFVSPKKIVQENFDGICEWDGRRVQS